MDISWAQWLVLLVAAVLIGITKTAIGGLATIAVAIFAFVFPAKESTAASLVLLISGDVLAVSLYRAQADWRLIRSLLPAVLPGIGLGVVFMHFVDNKVMLIGIGACIGVTLLVQLIMSLRHKDAPAEQDAKASLGLTVGAGVAAGFVTLVGNAAASVMSLYLLATHTNKMRFVASSAWFYFIVNLVKLPFMVGLGVLNWHHVLILLTLIPFVIGAGFLGKQLLARINQGQFEKITLVFTVIACVLLLGRGILA